MNAESSLLVWSSACQTDTGKVRKTNQDACLALPELGLWAVADGMGGHEAGEVASQLVIDYLCQVGEPRHLDDFIAQTKQQLLAVNAKLREIARDRYGSRPIGSTVVVFLAFGTRCAYLWAGDSRLYLLRDHALSQLTVDHSLVEEHVRQGVLRREDAHNSPQLNVLTRAVGGNDELDVDVAVASMHDGDTFLLCSDGLYKEATDADLVRTLDDADSSTAVQALIHLALQRGARDNVTAAVVKLRRAVRQGT
jgi:serine/threonine protein phosphatase PrpC